MKTHRSYLVGALRGVPLVALYCFQSAWAAPATPAAKKAPQKASTVNSKATATPTATPAATPAATSKKAAKPRGQLGQSVTLGVDYYYGASDLPGFKRFNDGFWAGYGLGFPSEGRVQWEDGKGSAARVTLGLGDYRTQAITNRQPLEAWYKAPVGKWNVTAGKFWVPFALTEWEGETKRGLLVERGMGLNGIAASINYNNITNSGNFYTRFSRRLRKNATVGVSLGAGDGLTFGSLHNKGLGLDASVAWKGWRLQSEYVLFQRRAADRFRFGYARLSYEKLRRLTPYVAYYNWKDKSGTFGDFRSTVLGLNLQLTPQLALEGATSSTSMNDNVSWVQLHWKWDHRFPITP
ncbi:MAG: hypothetical protein M3347_15655 [Armatimonadota bacterium]|nr:hypothetical protein [Armatimonadota bacterium]